jgi:aldose 1-epimerase
MTRTTIASSFTLVAAFLCAAFTLTVLPTTAGEPEVTEVHRQSFGTGTDGQVADRYTLTNSHGTIVRLTNVGAAMTEMHVRDRDGTLGDVVLGYDSVAEYAENAAYMGCIVGRVANRVSNARFTIDGIAYEVAKNFATHHHLHGGISGFTHKFWNAKVIAHQSGQAVHFDYLSVDGEEGYPGNLTIGVTYVLTEENGIRIEYEATTDKPTPLNVTNHAYFNLSGHDAGKILDHVVRIDADFATERGEDGIPTGQILSLTGTPLDFRQPTRIGDRIDELEFGYDHNFVLAGESRSEPVLFAEVYDPASGRVLQGLTTQPGVQLYSSGFLDTETSKGGNDGYGQFEGFCLETQHFPDAINKPHFPSVVLRPGETYRQITEYRFSVR